jgi:hypothetical protein
MSLFSESTLRRTAIATIACFSLLTAGCFNRVQIKPDQAEKLNKTHKAFVWNPFVFFGVGAGGLVHKNVVKLERDDGRIYRMNGAGDLIVTTDEDGEVRFEHPIVVDYEQGSLKVAGKNRSATSFSADEIEQVEVYDKDEKKTTQAVIGGVFGIAAVSVATFFLVRNSANGRTTP